MPNEEWGVKRVCPTCATRFYDLRQDPMTCPSCAATFTLESLTATKPKAPRPEKAKQAPVADDAEVIDDDDADTVEGDDIADDILEDDDDDDDNSDLEDIKEVASDDDD
jgi:uncharacterized protein (TIGR02300 family)